LYDKKPAISAPLAVLQQYAACGNVKMAVAGYNRVSDLIALLVPPLLSNCMHAYIIIIVQLGWRGNESE
jgi:hypothetical protein